MTLPTTSNVTRPRSAGYKAELNGLYLQIAPSTDPDRRMIITTAPLESDRVNTSESPEEFSSAFGDVFARSDFTGGEGLDFAHERTQAENAAARFWASENLDVRRPDPGEQRSITLSKTLSRTVSDTGYTTSHAVLTNGTLIVADGNNVAVITNADTASPTVSSQDPHAGDPATPVLDLAAAPGNVTYAALNANGVHKRSAAGTWSSFATGTYARVWWAKTRVLGYDSAGDKIVEFSSAGTPTDVLTLGDVTPVGLTDAGAAILVAASDGLIYSLALDETTNTLGIAGQTDLGDLEGDVPTAIVSHAGVVLIATSGAAVGGGSRARLWQAVLDGTVLGEIQLLRTWDPVTTEALSVAGFHDIGGIIRFALLRGSNVEVWTYDVATEGLVNVQTQAVTGDAVVPVQVNGRSLMLVDGNGLYRSTDTYVSEGWVIGPLGDFFSADDKSWVSLTVDCDVPSGASVEVAFATEPEAILDADSSHWRPVLVVTGLTSSRTVNLQSITSRYIALKATLQPNLSGATPELRSFSARGLPTTSEVIVRLPVSVGDVVERPFRKPYRVPGHGRTVFSALQAMEGQAATLTLLEPSLIVRGVVERVESVIYDSRRRGLIVPLAMVTVRGRKGSAGESFGDEGGFGFAGVWAGEVPFGGNPS